MFSGSKIVVARICLFIAEHCSIRSVDHLSALIKASFPKHESAQFDLKRSKCTAILRNVWKPYFLKVLIEDIGKMPYSLILDESTDIATGKMLGIVVQYVSLEKECIVSTFLSLETLQDGTAASITNAVNSLVLKVGLDPKKCIGIGTDNASVMVGTLNGVHKKLESLWGKKLILVRCTCHSIQLAVSEATKILPRNLEFMIKEIYNWFSHSTLKQQQYVQLFKTIRGEDPLKILNTCDTRWLSIYSALERIVDQWDPLTQYFRNITSHEKDFTADLILNMLHDKTNFCYFLYMKKILYDVNILNKTFQGKNEPFKVINDLFNLIEMVSKQILNPSSRVNVFSTSDLKSYINPQPYLGYSVETELKKLDPVEAKNIRTRCIDFTLELIQQLKQRLPNNFELFRFIQSFSVENVLRVIKPKLTAASIMDDFNLETQFIDKIESQWDNITVVKWPTDILTTGNSVPFWVTVYKYKDAGGQNPFRELATLAIMILSLPISNADVERLFSIMNLVKSKIRNKMTRKTCVAILLIRYGLNLTNRDCHSFEIPSDVVKIIGTSKAYIDEDERRENTDEEEEDDISVFLPNM